MSGELCTFGSVVCVSVRSCDCLSVVVCANAVTGECTVEWSVVCALLVCTVAALNRVYEDVAYLSLSDKRDSCYWSGSADSPAAVHLGNSGCVYDYVMTPDVVAVSCVYEDTAPSATGDGSGYCVSKVCVEVMGSYNSCPSFH